MTNETRELLSFIKKSPSVFHACESIKQMLNNAGFTEVFEWENVGLEGGRGYYTVRNDSSVIAFITPNRKIEGFNITASHDDSPTYKIKNNPENAHGMYVSLNTEAYGGAIASTWLDRPLSVAGRLLIKAEDGIVKKLVNVDRALLLIPNLAPHMSRIESLNPAVDLVPLFGDDKARGGFYSAVAEAAGVQEESIVGSDLFLYSRTEGTVWGSRGEFVSAPKLDDLMCAFSSVKALCESKPQSNTLNVCAVFDNEEVGSRTEHGASSTFLYDTLKRIVFSLGGNEVDFMQAVARGFIVSADNAHAVHPNHPEFADNAHRPEMNGGIVIKHHVGGNYITDGVSSALFEAMCESCGVPTQHFHNRSDLKGGSTLGNISGTQVSLHGVDIGMAQLAMHSSYETAGESDTAYLICALREFYKTAFVSFKDGWHIVKGE